MDEELRAPGTLRLIGRLLVTLLWRLPKAAVRSTPCLLGRHSDPGGYGFCVRCGRRWD